MNSSARWPWLMASSTSRKDQALGSRSATGEVVWERDVNEGGVRCALPFEQIVVTCGFSGQMTGLDAKSGADRLVHHTWRREQPGRAG